MVAWTISDLRGAAGPEMSDVVEAIGFKGFVNDPDGEPGGWAVA